MGGQSIKLRLSVVKRGKRMAEEVGILCGGKSDRGVRARKKDGIYPLI